MARESALAKGGKNKEHRETPGTRDYEMAHAAAEFFKQKRILSEA